MVLPVLAVASKPAEDKALLPFRINVAPQVARLKFHINDFANFRGVTSGASALFDYRKAFDFYGGVAAEWMMGSIDARNSMSRSIHDFDSQIRIGYTLSIWRFPTLTLTPYSGMGFEYISQHLRSDPAISSLQYRYYHYYIPVGMIINFNVLEYFNFGIAGQWRPDINARLKTSLLNGLQFRLKRQAGYIVELPFQFLIKCRNNMKGEISFIPYLKREVDGELNAQLPSRAYLNLPEQSYKFWGLRLALGLRF